jgi:hypothetical protein
MLCAMKLPEDVRERFRREGRRGGRARADALPAARRSAIARHAAIRRWIRARFGAPSFAEIGLPGGATIDKGLADLAAGDCSVESLLVSLAAPRLRREGVPLPPERLEDADGRCYRLLERMHGDLAHARYLAWLRQVASFADACLRARTDGDRRAP